MQTIDITITAALRPAVVETTALSVYSKLVQPHAERYRFRTIVNIDPVGESGVSQERIERIYRAVFDNIILFKPRTASFPEAIQRVWQAVDADFTFYVQDSKEILQNIPLDSIIQAFHSNPDLATVSISEMKKSHSSPEPLEWDDKHGMYVAPFFHKAVTCRPSFLRREYVHWISKYFRAGVSAEKTMKAHDDRLDADELRLIQSYSVQYRYGFLLLDEENKPPYVENIGRKWRLEHGFTKPQGGGISGSWSQETRTVLNRKYFRLWKEVRGRQLRTLWNRIKAGFRS